MDVSLPKVSCAANPGEPVPLRHTQPESTVTGVTRGVGSETQFSLIAPKFAAYGALRDPDRIEGEKAMGYEIVEQLGWRAPDGILYPVSSTRTRLPTGVNRVVGVDCAAPAGCLVEFAQRSVYWTEPVVAPPHAYAAHP
jgi:hypothetical protein